MKAIVHTAYGPPDELELREVEKPVPRDNEVLIRIHATTVTSSDCNVRNLTFAPTWSVLPMRMQFGLREPKITRLGIDLAGEVEVVGKAVKRYREGDQVFGRPDPALGTHAEYISIAEDGVLAAKPDNMTFEEAACLPLAANTALYFIRDLGKIQPGQTVLIIGASGGIGTFAVQLAKHYGAHVAGVCSTANVEMVKSLGADRVIDYTREDFAASEEVYDVVFDVVSKTSYARCKDSLKKNGLYLAALPTLAIVLQTVWTSMVGDKKVKFGDAAGKAENLVFLKELVEAGKLRSVIDRRYPLEQIAEAFRYAETGHKKGNVVITVEE